MSSTKRRKRIRTKSSDISTPKKTATQQYYYANSEDERVARAHEARRRKSRGRGKEAIGVKEESGKKGEREDSPTPKENQKKR